ncbi:MAG: gpmA [Parcubacteria group bacterium Gr01-1014_73]|nr:MAG: gpmA [Parcubacteria group bacterium Gr01-1014_73]
MKIYIFRHGETTYNRARQFTGFDDPPLTELGLQQAAIIAEKLKDKNFEIAYQTSLQRSKNTLKAVLRHHPNCREIIEDNRMIERNYGQLNGLTHEKFIAKNGEEKFNLIHRGFFEAPPSGESFAMVEIRVQSFIDDLLAKMRRENKNAVISAHGNSIRLFRKIMENASIEETVSWTIPYDDYYDYEV